MMKVEVADDVVACGEGEPQRLVDGDIQPRWLMNSMIRDVQQQTNRLTVEADPTDEPLLKQSTIASEKGRIPERRQQSDDESFNKMEDDTRLSGDPLAAFLDHCDLGSVENFLRWGTLVGVLLWLIAIVIAYYFTPKDSFVQLEGLELKASVALFLVLLVTNGSRFLPFLLVPAELQVHSTGILFGCFAVQAIAITSLGLTIVGPAPVFASPFSHTRVYLVSWAARVALRFIITFYMEGIDIPLVQRESDAEVEGHENWTGSSSPVTSWWHASAVALAAAAGPLCILAPDDQTLQLMHQVSFLLFGITYIRLSVRFWRLAHTTKGSTVDSVEAFERCRMSFRLMLLCSLAWTLYELKDFVLSLWFQSYSFLKNECFAMMIERIYEGLCSVLYVMMILRINDAVFDEPMRAVRRLEALRTMMSAVWDNSSDIVVLCIPSASTGHIKAIVSPAFIKFEEQYELSATKPKKKEDRGRFAVVLEVDILPQDEDDDKRSPSHRAFTVDLGKPIDREEAQRIRRTLQEQRVKRKRSDELSIGKRNIAALAKLIAKASSKNSRGAQVSLLSHDMLAKGSDGQEHSVNCEANITKLESHSLLIVIRDISERFHRFEAEKRLIREVTERKKDAEANRFIRHEVKNGLLAAIALIENLQGEIKARAATESTGRDRSPTRDRDTPPFEVLRRRELESSCTELDATVNEILETILDDAMSRDVVHDRYEPYMHRVDVAKVLTPTKIPTAASRNRFPLILEPNPFPQVILDPRLLRFIHRNAVSNAARYGKPGGGITTKVTFQDNQLLMQVINLPGDQHTELVKLSKEAAARVFLPGTQLHREMGLASAAPQDNIPLNAPSAGDGAWIMQKCAEAMKGSCSIQFTPEVTIFSMRCPTLEYVGSTQRSSDAGIFSVPDGTFGIVIDDSGIQRKLMDRFLDMVGVRKSKRRILGKDTEEILGLRDALVHLIRANPESNFLLIVDENLDIVDGVRHQTLSGSFLVSQIRQELNPADESRILALVRSANDSAEDVALYRSRAHGFICKAPLKKESVIQMIAPVWKERFPCVRLERKESTGSDNGLVAVPEQLTFTPTSDDLMKTVNSIDALCLVMRTFNTLDAMGFRNRKVGSLAEMWPPLREELHKLKGDLKSLSSSPRMDTIITELDQLNSDNTAEELGDRWQSIRTLIISVI